MSGGLQIAFSLVLLLVVTPGVAWALVNDIRRGETAHFSKWSPNKSVYRRDREPGDFWLFVSFTAVGGFIALGLGVWCLYGALRHI